MCGICGIIDLNGIPVKESAVAHMMQAMKHRGPDDEGIFTEGGIGLGHVRLSIIDLSEAGHQPMFSADKRFVIVFNGEVYNYIEIRKLLEKEFVFTTQTDTEVIINAYRKWGIECLHRFNGMFAFAIYDREEQSLFIARDRFGIKPFNYSLNKDRFVFASDIPPLLAYDKSLAESDERSVYDFLVFNRSCHNEQTFYKNIQKLQHGHFMMIKNKRVEITRWYHPKDQVNKAFANAEELRGGLLDSISLQLRSDVPLGACLSGGLDSSSIVSLIIKKLGFADIHTFSAIYEKGFRGDESTFIEEFRPYVRNFHFVKPDAASLLHDIQRFTDALTEPVSSTSEYAEFRVMELSKQYVTVLLNGQGADEMMAGYLYFAGYFYKELFKKMRWGTMLREMRRDRILHGRRDGPMSFLYFMMPSSVKEHLSLRGKTHIDNEFIHHHRGSNSVILDELYDAGSLHDAFIKHFEHKFEHHLIWADRSGMWFSLETRFPFLDHNFVERTLALQSRELIHNGWNKHILREAMKGILPEAIRMRRDKIGYETPEDEWFRTPGLSGLAADAINSKTIAECGFYDIRSLQKLQRSHLERKSNAGQELWKVLNLYLWLNKMKTTHNA